MSIYNYAYRSGISSILVLEQAIETSIAATSFETFDPFFELHNEMMGRLMDSGILFRLNELFLNPNGFKMRMKNELIGAQVLTMDHLLIGFQICLAVLSISAIAFAVEVATKELPRFCIKIKN